MNLLVDFGNTRVKAAIFNDGRLMAKSAFDQAEDLFLWLKKYNGIQKCLIGSVTKAHEAVYALLQKQFTTTLFKTDTPTPLQNLYHSALTLGSDRLAASVGAYHLCPNKNVLSIDAGTCIKYNFVNHKNEYLGGAISPGLQMRLKAMHHYTAALPVVEMDKQYTKLVGTNTQESLLSGALTATACEVDGMIGRYLIAYTDLEVYVTGGDAAYLCKQVKNRFFAEPDLIMIGLNSILDFNDK
ncbi:MAG: type III pantothenate kinase [Bacteroidota bacterium]